MAKNKPKMRFDYVEKIERFLERNGTLWPILIPAIGVIFYILQFNVRISEGGDDSTYIEAAWNYAKSFSGYFYSASATLYPLFLTPLVMMFGINLVALKLSSLLFAIAFLFGFIKLFQRQIPYFILIPISLIMATNWQFAYYASQTYTEFFFLFLLIIYLYFFKKTLTVQDQSLKDNARLWLSVGLFMTLIILTRNIAIAIVPATVVFLIYFKRYLSLAKYLLATTLFYGLWLGLKSLIWGASDQYASQNQSIWLKNPYDVSEGVESPIGIIERFFTNVNDYLSHRIGQILGMVPMDSRTSLWLISIIVVIATLWGFYALYKSEKKFFIYYALITLALIGGTFVALSPIWNQTRFILIHIPLILALIIFGLYELRKINPWFDAISVLFVVLLLGFNLRKSFVEINKNIPILGKNLGGNLYYGYTPDWENYLRMSEWAAKNLPENSKVATRKASMSFIYSKGKTFYPVNRAFSGNADEILQQFYDNGVTHYLMAELRAYPDVHSPYIITTMHQLADSIIIKYPYALQQVNEIGIVEKSNLFKIIYPPNVFQNKK